MSNKHVAENYDFPRKMYYIRWFFMSWAYFSTLELWFSRKFWLVPSELEISKVDCSQILMIAKITFQKNSKFVYYLRFPSFQFQEENPQGFILVLFLSTFNSHPYRLPQVDINFLLATFLNVFSDPSLLNGWHQLWTVLQ